MTSESLRTTPFFIVGNPRSGTTLLRTILCGHSRIYIPNETGFLAHLSEYSSRSNTRDDVQRLVNRIGRMNREWSELVDDFDSFFESLADTRLGTILDALYRIKIQPQGAVRWGDKGPSYVRVIPKIDQIFPTAQFVHIIRDGRDCVLSAMEKWGDRYWYYDTYYLLRSWQRNVTLGQDAATKLGPNRYLEIRYEQLVDQTDATIRRVCRFLGESFEPSMLDHKALGEQISAPTGHHEVARTINRQSVDNWRRNMETFDQKLANRLAGEQLAELGYALPDLPRMTLTERLRLTRLATRFQVTDNLRRLLFAIGWLKMSREKAAESSSVQRR